MALTIDDGLFYFRLETPDKVGNMDFTIRHDGDTIEAAFKKEEVEDIYKHLHRYFGSFENV